MIISSYHVPRVLSNVFVRSTFTLYVIFYSRHVEELCLVQWISQFEYRLSNVATTNPPPLSTVFPFDSFHARRRMTQLGRLRYMQHFTPNFYVLSCIKDDKVKRKGNACVVCVFMDTDTICILVCRSIIDQLLCSAWRRVVISYVVFVTLRSSFASTMYASSDDRVALCFISGYHPIRFNSQ